MRPVPRLLRWIASMLVRGPGAPFVLGDLDESRRRDVAQGVPRHRAEFRYLSNLLRSAANLWGDAVRRRVRRIPGSGISVLDLKLGLRMLVRYPGLTLVGGVAMAFAIAVGTGTFEFIMDAAYPRLPVEEGDRVVRIHQVSRMDAGDRLAVSLDDYLAWRQELRTVEHLGAFHGVQRNLEPEEGSEPVVGVAITASGFDVARVPPLLGRPLVAGDEEVSAAPVAVLSHDLWRSRFGGDPEVVGGVVRLGEERTIVVGVMPPDFAFPAPVDFWMPLRIGESPGGEGAPAGEGTVVAVFGRLASGVGLAEARAEVAAIGMRSPRDGSGMRGERGEPGVRGVPELAPFADPAVTMGDLGVGGIMTVSALFLVGLVVIPCANVALLVFARAATREGEIVIRSALGASRGRIVRQLFAETLVLAAFATVVGLMMASWGLKWVIGVMNAQDAGLPVWFGDTLSPTTVAWAFALGLVGAGVAGILPALKVTGADVQAGLQRSAGRGSGTHVGWLWTGIIVTQVALTVLFVPVVVWLGLDTWSIRNADLGAAAGSYLTVQLEMDGDAGGSTGGARPGWGGDLHGSALETRLESAVQELHRRLEAEPGVQGATLASQLPGGSHPRWWIEVEGVAAPASSTRGHRLQVAHVASDFFEVFGAPVVSGRGFAAADFEPGARTLIVNESFAEVVLGGRNAVDARIRFPDEALRDDAAAAPWYRVVGVVEDLALSLDPDLPHRQVGIYLPLTRGSAYPLRMAIQLDGPPEAFTARLRELAAAIDPTLRLDRTIPLPEVPRDLLSAYDTWFRVIVVAGGLALLLTLAGIYAIVSFTVSRRTREIGVRVALGADRRRVVTAVFSRALVQVGSGILAGGTLLAVVIFAAWEGSFSFSVGRALLLVGYLGIMMAVCLTACVVPMRRVLAVEPTEALRAEG